MYTKKYKWFTLPVFVWMWKNLHILFYSLWHHIRNEARPFISLINCVVMSNNNNNSNNSASQILNEQLANVFYGRSLSSIRDWFNWNVIVPLFYFSLYWLLPPLCVCNCFFFFLFRISPDNCYFVLYDSINKIYRIHTPYFTYF